MASYTTRGGLWIPEKTDESYQFAGGTFVMDASGEKVTITFQAPATGNLQRFEFYVQAVGNAPDNGLKCSFQQRSLTDGIANGTILGASNGAHVTTAGGTPSAVGWVNPGNFGEVAAVTIGDELSLVIEFGGAGFTAGDNITIGQLNRAGDTGLPFSTSATSSKQSSLLPVVALVYDNGDVYMVDEEIQPAKTTTDFDFDTGTSIREAGLKFQVPWNCALVGWRAFMNFAAGSADHEWRLYDASNNVLVGPISRDGDVGSSTTGSRWYLQRIAPYTLTRNTTYRLVVKPTTTTNVRLIRYQFDTAAHMLSVPPGLSSWCATSANSGLTWTDYNNGSDGYYMPRVHLNLNNFDDGDGGGGTTIAGTTMLRGMVA